MAKIPSHDLMAFTSSKTLGGVLFTAGTNIFSGLEIDDSGVPDACIFFFSDGGSAPLDRMGVTTSDHDVSVIAIVRGNSRDEYGAINIAADLRRYLHGAKPAGYDIVLCDQSLGLRLIDDAANRPRWKFTFRTRYEETSLP